VVLLPSSQCLPETTESIARGINDAGQAVGQSLVGGVFYATEWSGGSVIELGGLPGSTDSGAAGINDAGQVVGFSVVDGTDVFAIEWDGGSVINLGGLPGSVDSSASAINNAGQVVGSSLFPPLPIAVPEPSTWAMMLLGFAGLAFAGYRRSERVLRQNACLSIYHPTYSDLQRRERGTRLPSSPSVQ
jgi:probable HAF family extracellular repeat protein